MIICLANTHIYIYIYIYISVRQWSGRPGFNSRL